MDDALRVISGNLDYHVARSAYYALIDCVSPAEASIEVLVSYWIQDLM